MQPIYADASLLVFDKPSGLLAVPGRGPDKQDCLSARAQARWPDALVVHRLDMDTSGLMLLARGAAMQRALSIAFARRQVRKRYQALVAGRVTTEAATEVAAPADSGWNVIDLPLIVDWPNRPRSIVDQRIGKPSVTRWRVIDDPGNDASRTRLELEPVSGRSHQLRVHLQALGHPILGDPLYADAAARARSERLLLHACELSLAHPVTGETLLLRSEAPF